MEIFALVLLMVIVAYKLGLFEPVLDLKEVAVRESKIYNLAHKDKVGKRYENMSVDLDVEKINKNIEKLKSLKFD